MHAICFWFAEGKKVHEAVTEGAETLSADMLEETRSGLSRDLPRNERTME